MRGKGQIVCLKDVPKDSKPRVIGLKEVKGKCQASGGTTSVRSRVKVRQVGWSANLPWVMSRAGGQGGARCAQGEAAGADALTAW